MKQPSQRTDYEILLYGSDAATREERIADSNAAAERFYRDVQVPTGHGMNEYGYQQGIVPNRQPPKQAQIPVPNRLPSIHTDRRRPSSPENVGKTNRPDKIDPNLALLAALARSNKKQSPIPPKIEIKNPAVPAKKDYTVIVALIGLATVMMGRRK